MSRPWLKLWTCALDKSKVMALPGDQFKVWTCLLMICERHSRDGLLPPLDDCAFMMHKGEEWLQPLVQAIVARGLIDETPDGLRMHDWLDWQTSKPSDEPERVRVRVQRHRENKRAIETPGNALQGDTNTSNALPEDETPCNAIPIPVTPVTPKEEIREEENRSEKEQATPASPKRRAVAHAEQFMALADACRYDLANLTKDARGRLNEAAAQLDAVDASGDDIAAAADALCRAWGREKLTPHSLASNWPRFARAPSNVVNIRPVEKTPVELAWDAATPEEQAVGWQRFIGKWKVEHDGEEAHA